MKLKHSMGWANGLAFALGLSACSGGREADDVGVVRAEIQLAPASVRCINVKAVNGSTTVNVPFNVVAGSTSSFLLSGLPYGSDTFTAQAYGVVCASIGSATATYVSDSVVTTVSSVPATITLPMHASSGGAAATANVIFPNPHGVVTEFKTPTDNSRPNSITVGPDGNLWYTESTANQIGQFVVAYGYSNEFALPGSSNNPQSITTGPDGYLWFTTYTTYSWIGRMSTTGEVQQYPLPAGSIPDVIVPGADGNLYFVDFTGKIGRVAPLTGVITEFTVPTVNSSPSGITAGSDGNIWFTETGTSKIGRLTVANGTITEFTVPTPNSGPSSIAAGSDGNLWFTESSKIGKLTTAGVFTEFAVPSPATTNYITAGPDGNLWFTGDPTIGRVTPSGTFTLFESPNPLAIAKGLTAGPDGNVWLTEYYTSEIVRITP